MPIEKQAKMTRRVSYFLSRLMALTISHRMRAAMIAVITLDTSPRTNMSRNAKRRGPSRVSTWTTFFFRGSRIARKASPKTSVAIVSFTGSHNADSMSRRFTSGSGPNKWDNASVTPPVTSRNSFEVVLDPLYQHGEEQDIRNISMRMMVIIMCFAAKSPC